MASLIAHVLEVIRTPETPVVLRGHSGRREPIGALPTITLTEDGAHAREFVIHRTGLGGACIGALFVRIMDDEDVAIRLLVFLHHITLAGVGPVAARVDRHHVDAGLALDDPLGELPAGTAGGGDAEAVALVEPKISRAPGG